MIVAEDSGVEISAQKLVIGSWHCGHVVGLDGRRGHRTVVIVVVLTEKIERVEIREELLERVLLLLLVLLRSRYAVKEARDWIICRYVIDQVGDGALLLLLLVVLVIVVIVSATKPIQEWVLVL